MNLAIISGHVLENFNNLLYGFLAVFLASIFFPDLAGSMEIFASYGAFAAGFFARPLGAIFFGFLGDKYGRRKSLILSITLIGIPTCIIGIIPTYQELGITAPIILIVCRLLQGFFLGGEFTGANLYISESKSKGNIGTKTGILISSGVVGAILATLAGALVTMQSMPHWAWRIPFVLGGLTSMLLYYIRRNLKETEDFKERDSNQQYAFPWKTLIRNHKFSFVVSFFLSGLTVIPLYCATILGNKLFKELGFSTSESITLNLCTMLLDVFLINIYGRLADKIGFQNQLLLGSATVALVMIPAFTLISGEYTSLYQVLSFVGLLIAAGGIINGCTMPYIAKLFPINCRYSGVAVSVTTGQALLGGTTPLIGLYLSEFTGSPIAAGAWGVTIGSLALLMVLLEGRKEKSLQGLQFTQG